MLEDVIAEYRGLYGEPEYRYFKKRVSWQSARRGQEGQHFIPIGDGDEVSKEEYEANVAEYERIRRLAFLSKYPQSYWKYDRKMVKDGWRERLIQDIEAFALPQAERK